MTLTDGEAATQESEVICVDHAMKQKTERHLSPCAIEHLEYSARFKWCCWTKVIKVGILIPTKMGSNLAHLCGLQGQG